MNAMPEPIPFQSEGPQPLLREIPKGEPYPVEALGALREVVEAVQDVTQAPVAIAAQSALAVASLAVQAFADVETLGGFAPCSLFCLTIAESGERKSSCDRQLMNGIRSFEAAQSDSYREARAAHETALAIWQAKHKRLIGEASGKEKSKSAGAEADLRTLGAEPTPPLSANVTAMDPTFEGLVKLYGTGRPALGLFSDEAGGFIGGHAMNADNRLKTMAGLNRLWNGEPIDRTRAGDGATTYRGRRLAAHLMVQPVAARPLLADAVAGGMGFLARFLLTEPASHIGTRLRQGHSPTSDMAIAAFAARLGTILQTEMPTPGHPQELVPARLPLSRPARELLHRFHVAVELAQAAGGPMEQVRAYASKAVEQAARIAGVLTLWADLDAPVVTPQAMGDGIALAQFYLGEARRLLEAGAVSVETGRAEALRQWLVESWPHTEVTARDVVRNGPNRMRETKVVRETLAMLETHGWLARLPEGSVVQGMARKEAFRIVRPGHAV